MTTAQFNLEWAVDLAISEHVHLDFHLDYHLDEEQPPLIWALLKLLRERKWMESNAGKTVCLGHCTRMTLFERRDWERLVEEVGTLPVYFIGLPTSDIFMMGRPKKGEEGRSSVRGTLQIPWMVNELGLKAAIGVNNVGNQFTPHGSADPLSVAAMGVGMYQIGTEQGGETLYAS